MPPLLSIRAEVVREEMIRQELVWLRPDRLERNQLPRVELFPCGGTLAQNGLLRRLAIEAVRNAVCD